MSMRLTQAQMLEPYYELYFNNATVPLHEKLKKYITLIEFEESDSEADVARITVTDIDFVFSNSIQLTKKMPVKLRMGFKNNLRTMINGNVTHIEADFNEEGVPTLVIGVTDSTNVMATKKKSRKWTKQKASTVVAQIAREYGFTPRVTATEAIIDEITQEDETDAQLLMRLAEDEAFQVYIIPDSKILFFGERFTDANATDTIYYKSGDHTVRYFRPNFVEKNKADNTSATEGNVSDQTGNSTNKSVTASSSGSSSSSKSSSSSQSSSQYSIDTVTGGMERER